ncbi:LacI family DNA-binding transcriptional regulator [Paenibacillus thermotolerans]|uniref:LacI family DNA-binding transcriptional regulator n=1 Tax=Paenibacillus thermotolerans TaxID=3027807 RepID=UPI002368BB8A|nr:MULTISPECIES: LacI family DNA-binding transcriptional regulator [unclassified Paenibacillus]
MATMRDVAKLAQVSVATVSRVLNKNGYVLKATEERVYEAVRLLGYEMNGTPKVLASERPVRAIALFVPDIANPYFAEMARAIEDISRANGYHIILCNSDDQGHKEKSYLETLSKGKIEGIIFISTSLSPNDMIEVEKYRIPYVFIDRAPNHEQRTVVRVKDYEGANIAVQHLLDIGCRKIAHIYGPQEYSSAKERLKGYEDAVSKHPWYSPSLLVPGYFRYEGGMRAVEVLLERHPDVDGIFIANDIMAVGALKSLHQLGVKVPEQIAVCGFDGIAMTELVSPDITTVAQPIKRIGWYAAELLFKKMSGELAEDRVHELDVELISRRSTSRMHDPGSTAAIM